MARILLTAGPTRAHVDDVRYLTNASSGRMAKALAEAALARGHEVVIVSGPVHVTYPRKARVIPVVTTGEMLAAALAELPAADGVIAAAAPCDFEKITAKRCDLIVVNDVTALESDENAVAVYDSRHAHVGSKRASKRAVASWLIRLIETRLGAGSRPSRRRV